MEVLVFPPPVVAKIVNVTALEALNVRVLVKTVSSEPRASVKRVLFSWHLLSTFMITSYITLKQAAVMKKPQELPLDALKPIH